MSDMSGEGCDPIGKEWFRVAKEAPRADGEPVKRDQACRRAGVSFLLNVPPDRHGVIPKKSVDALMCPCKNAGV
jgi:hypothetical protein